MYGTMKAKKMSIAKIHVRESIEQNRLIKKF